MSPMWITPIRYTKAGAKKHLIAFGIEEDTD